MICHHFVLHDRVFSSCRPSIYYITVPIIYFILSLVASQLQSFKKHASRRGMVFPSSGCMIFRANDRIKTKSIVIHDLYKDLKDGYTLVALAEALGMTVMMCTTDF